MEYLIFALFAFGFIVIIMISGWIQEKQNEKRFVRKLRTDYGILPKRDYKPEEYANIAQFFKKHQTGFSIDDITWNDLEMDELFKRMNYTYSSAGEEYLYHTLRTPMTDQAVLNQREETITDFRQATEERVAWQFIFAKMGRTGKYSIYDYLNYLDELGTRSNFRHYIAMGAFAASIAILFISVQVGICLMIGTLVFNLTSYFKIKKDIEPYITSFAYIFRLLNCIDAMEKRKTPFLKEQIAEMVACKKAFQKFKRGSYLLMSSARMSASNNPLEIILDYLRMGFHLDLIKFNNMLTQVRLHTTEIDKILTIAGSIETMIAIGAWRESMTQTEDLGYAVPLFLPDKGIEGREMYHPLLNHPIKNDIDVSVSVLLTGSNASGKSTFLKTVAINAILAQTVHTCMAESYRTGMFYIASSMSLRDDVLEGDSYYMVEIKSMKRLMDLQKESTVPVLVFVDEVLRGTNTVERIAASTQILRSLNGSNSICFAATHDIELTKLLKNDYENYHFEEVFNEGDIFFPYKIMKGPATTRNAIKLLAAMGYDPALIEDAEHLAEGFMKTGKWQEI